MKLPKPPEGDFQTAPAGTHEAICYAVVQLGTQPGGDGYEDRPKLHVSWELVSEFMDNGKPFISSKWYTWSMHEKATLRKDLESWRGRAFQEADFDGGFQLENLLGKKCMITLTEQPSGKAKLTGVTPLPRKLGSPSETYETINHKVCLSLDRDEFDPSAFASLSERMQERIRESPEYKALQAAPQNEVATAPAGEDIPF